MKKFYTLLLASCASLLAAAQHNEKPQLSARTQGLITTLKTGRNADNVMRDYTFRILSDGKYYLNALIKVSDAALAERNLMNLGVKIGTKAGDIWTVKVPYDKLLTFAETQGIKAIEADNPVFPALDIAKRKTKVDSAQAGYNLPMRYSGKDVVMGIIDFGFDYNHPAFFDTLGQTFRIKKVWELAGIGTPPVGYSFGNEITDTSVIKTTGTDNPAQMHGTSVAGIAGGSGVGGDATNNQYRGIAYESDFVLVGVRRDTLGNQWMHGSFSDFVDGIKYIFNHATSVSKPAVVNISWGSQSGAHDGTSLFNQACNNLSGPGRIVVMSAGNEGGNKIHLNKSFTATDTVVHSFVTFSDTVYQRTWLDAWGEAGKTFCGAISLYNGGSLANTTGFVCANDGTQNFYLIAKNGLDTCYVEVNTSPAEINNGKPHIFLNVFNKSSDSVVVSYKATDGHIDAWDESYFYGYVHKYSSEFESLSKPGITNGNINSTVSEMGAADSVLLVGAYISNNHWTNINGVQFNVAGFNDKIAGFSSRGPMIDGRIKPDITAPGLVVATSVSSYDTGYTPTGEDNASVMTSYVNPANGKTYYYAQFSGTSAAAPVASGIVALLLQQKPDLSVSELKDILFTTAIIDGNTGNLPAAGNNVWGHGKINAYDAMKKLIQTTDVYEFTGKKLDCLLYPNPNNGNFTIDYVSDRDKNLIINISDITGKVIAVENWKVNTGFNQHTTDISNKAKGIYFVKIISNDGNVVIKTVLK